MPALIAARVYTEISALIVIVAAVLCDETGARLSLLHGEFEKRI